MQQVILAAAHRRTHSLEPRGKLAIWFGLFKLKVIEEPLLAPSACLLSIRPTDLARYISAWTMAKTIKTTLKETPKTDSMPTASTMVAIRRMIANTHK